MTRVDIDGSVLRGALAKWQARKSLDDNPFPDSPGYYSLHRAWKNGFLHSEEVLAAHDEAPCRTFAKKYPDK